MTIALVDNGSLEPAAHRQLRVTASALGARTGTTVHAVSWKHSDRVPPEELDGQPAWTLARWVRAQRARGETEFVLVPFFISAQGAIGSSLRADLERLTAECGPFTFTFTDGLGARGALPRIVSARIRETIAAHALERPAVIVVDHGGPSPQSARVRNDVADAVRAELGAAIGPLAAASMEGEEHAHNHPLLAAQLATPGFQEGDVVVAPLFLLPGRHAGAGGDLAQIADAAAGRPEAPAPRPRFTALVGTHPWAVDTLASALQDHLSSIVSHPSA